MDLIINPIGTVVVLGPVAPTPDLHHVTLGDATQVHTSHYAQDLAVCNFVSTVLVLKWC